MPWNAVVGTNEKHFFEALKVIWKRVLVSVFLLKATICPESLGKSWKKVAKPQQGSNLYSLGREGSDAAL